MADQTLLIAGPSASAFCYGLVDTGRFFRIYPEKRTPRRSALFGAEFDSENDYSDTDDPDKDSEMKTSNTRGVNTKVSPNYETVGYSQGTKHPKVPSQKFNSPTSEKEYDFAVRGSQAAVSAVMEIVRTHRREFEAAETGANVIRVNCVGSPDRTQAALHEIRERLE